jgi:hypothetical protein
MLRTMLQIATSDSTLLIAVDVYFNMTFKGIQQVNPIQLANLPLKSVKTFVACL